MTKKKETPAARGGGRGAQGKPTRWGGPYSDEARLRAVQEIVDRGATMASVSRALGVPVSTLQIWVRAYREQGEAGIRERVRKLGRPYSKERAAKREAVVEVREAHPEYGTRRIRDVLARFEALGVSESVVRRVLHEEGLLAERPPPTEAREHPERRFERAEPNQLWQSDIFTFLLRRHERLYLTAFMDDHSRFIVSYALAHHQRSELVMEALRRGIAAYGAPREILTDQGRQYTAWRGETDFELELRREGIRHIKSRPQHPQTLGKIERFWKTLWEEFLSRTVFADFADCERRIRLFIDAYNFQRPHQGIESLVPADRFFRSAAHVRESIEKGIAANALRLAHERPTQKPFYLVGRLGDRNLSIAAAGRGLQVRVGDEEPTTIELGSKEGDDGQNTVARWGHEATAKAQRPQAALAARAEGSGRDGAAAVPDDPERLERRVVGGGGGGARGDHAAALLPAREARASGDVDGALAWRAVGRVRGTGFEAAPSANRGAGEDEAAARASAVSDEDDSEAWGDDTRAEEAESVELDEEWLERFDEAEEDEGWAASERFDPDAGWRDRALEWERKLTSCDAGGDEEDVHASAGGAPGGARPVPGDARGAERRDDGVGGGAASRALAEPLSNAAPSWIGGPPQWNFAWASGASGDAGARGVIGARGGATAERERVAAGAARDDGASDERGIGDGARDEPSGARTARGEEAERDEVEDG